MTSWKIQNKQKLCLGPQHGHSCRNQNYINEKAHEDRPGPCLMMKDANKNRQV